MSTQTRLWNKEDRENTLKLNSVDKFLQVYLHNIREKLAKMLILH